MRRKLLGIIIVILIMGLSGCNKTNNNPYLSYKNGQTALIMPAKTKEVSINNDNATLYASIKNSIKLKFESFNVDVEHKNLYSLNDYVSNLTISEATRNKFVKNEIEILGANIIDGKLRVKFSSGLNDRGIFDNFKLRNIHLLINGKEYWSIEADKEGYYNEELRFGSDEYTTDLRFNYSQEKEFTFEVPANLLDCKAYLIKDNKDSYDVAISNNKTTLTNLAYLDVKCNILDNSNINDTTRIVVESIGEVIDMQIFMDNFKISNNLTLSKRAWAKGIHYLTIRATNKYAFVMEKTIKFNLNFIVDKSLGLSYQAYNPGVNQELPTSLENLGEEVSIGSNYQSIFSANSLLNFKVKCDEDKTIVWNGKSIANRTSFMQIFNTKTKEWQTVSTIFTDTSKDISLGYEIQNIADYLNSGDVYVRVGNKNLTIKKEISAYIYQITDFQYITQIAANSKGSVLGKEATKALESLSNYLINQSRETTYSVFTGDFVQTTRNADKEWTEAMTSVFNPLLKENVNFGVSSGNHDVGGLVDNSVNGSNALDDELNYDNFSKFLGEDSFKNKEYYKESFKNNRSHYDVITLNGHEFMFLYLGWGSSIRGIHVSQLDIDFATKVLNENKDKTVILSTHEYMGQLNKRTITGEFVYERLVKKYQNIKLVLSGHVNGSSQRTDYLDDDKDGITDRSVLQLLTDFQNEENFYGATFIRTIGLDFINNQLIFDLYSPYLNDYEIVVEENPDDVKRSSNFIFDFDLQKQGYSMITYSLE